MGLSFNEAEGESTRLSFECTTSGLTDYYIIFTL